MDGKTELIVKESEIGLPNARIRDPRTRFVEYLGKTSLLSECFCQHMRKPEEKP